MSMNYYELLGVNINASEEEIKTAYKREIKKWHPDVNKDEEAVSIAMKLNEAKDTLLDKEKRLEYDFFINNKDEEIYQKYTNSSHSDINVSNNYAEYEEKFVTKWEYLNQYLFCKNINIFRRIIGLIFVLLESLLCLILKYFIIILSFLCFVISSLIILLLKILSPILFVLTIYILYIILTKGFNNLINNNYNELRGTLLFLIIYIVTILLPYIGKLIISQKVFDLLYNKIDVFLFKKAVGYKE